MTVYLGRVGSLTRRGKADIYDYKKHGDRRKLAEIHDDPEQEVDSAVIDITKRTKTLS